MIQSNNFNRQAYSLWETISQQINEVSDGNQMQISVSMLSQLINHFDYLTSSEINTIVEQLEKFIEYFGNNQAFVEQIKELVLLVNNQLPQVSVCSEARTPKQKSVNFSQNSDLTTVDLQVSNLFTPQNLLSAKLPESTVARAWNTFVKTNEEEKPLSLSQSISQVKSVKCVSDDEIEKFDGLHRTVVDQQLALFYLKNKNESIQFSKEQLEKLDLLQTKDRQIAQQSEELTQLRILNVALQKKFLQQEMKFTELKQHNVFLLGRLEEVEQAEKTAQLNQQTLDNSQLHEDIQKLNQELGEKNDQIQQLNAQVQVAAQQNEKLIQELSKLNREVSEQKEHEAEVDVGEMTLQLKSYSEQIAALDADNQRLSQNLKAAVSKCGQLQAENQIQNIKAEQYSRIYQDGQQIIARLKRELFDLQQKVQEQEIENQHHSQLLASQELILSEVLYENNVMDCRAADRLTAADCLEEPPKYFLRKRSMNQEVEESNSSGDAIVTAL